MKKVKRLLVLLIAACMLWVWPVHPFKEVGTERSGDDGHVISKPIEVNESIAQSFKATDNNLIQLEFVIDYDERYPKEGQLRFELLDSKGEAVFVETLDYGQMPDYKYNGPIINVRLKKGRQYTYRLTNLNVTENMPCGVYTTHSASYSLKKGTLEIAGETLEGELLTRITANKPLTTGNTLAIWGCVAMVGFGVYELLERREKALNKRATGKNVSDKNEENGKEVSL